MMSLSFMVRCAVHVSVAQFSRISQDNSLFRNSVCEPNTRSCNRGTVRLQPIRSWGELAMASSSDSAPTPGQTNLALLLIRIAAGLVFLYHGSAILFGAFGGPGPQGFAAFMHAPVIVGYLVGLAQFAGGAAFLFGL